jgi:hypothetical protein
MFQNRSNKSRTQILDLVDDSLQPSILSQSDLQLVKGGMIVGLCIATSCTMGGGYDCDDSV